MLEFLHLFTYVLEPEYIVKTQCKYVLAISLQAEKSFSKCREKWSM